MRGLARRVNEALEQSEARLGGIHVSHAAFSLVPENRYLLLRSAQWLQPMDLSFDIAIRYREPVTPDIEIAAVRSTAHEVYHLRQRALLRPPRPDVYERTEEMRASLFETCIELAVFGAVQDRAADPLRQSDPLVAQDGSDLRASLQGNIDATGVLASIAGGDKSISSSEELARMDALCETLGD